MTAGALLAFRPEFPIRAWERSINHPTVAP